MRFLEGLYGSGDTAKRILDVLNSGGG